MYIINSFSKSMSSFTYAHVLRSYIFVRNGNLAVQNNSKHFLFSDVNVKNTTPIEKNRDLHQKNS